MENPIKMDDLGGPPLFLETPISTIVVCQIATLKQIKSYTGQMLGQMDNFQTQFRMLVLSRYRYHPRFCGIQGLNQLLQITNFNEKAVLAAVKAACW